MDSFETLVKVGGYIILFSVFLSLFEALPVIIPGVSALLPLLEVTNGLGLLREMQLPLQLYTRRSGADFLRRLLRRRTDPVHGAQGRLSDPALSHAKTGSRADCQSYGFSLSVPKMNVTPLRRPAHIRFHPPGGLPAPHGCSAPRRSTPAGN